jgi:hypothetical protein
MAEKPNSLAATLPVALALVAGLFICAVDNFAFAGEVSPIVIVGLIFLAAAGMACLAPRRRLLTTLAVWIWLPLAHVVKHLAKLPDTLQPNTYASIAMLAGFTLIVSLVGMVAGAGIRRSLSPTLTPGKQSS